MPKLLSSGKGTATDVKYQPEVDGLRAVAVIPVVLFHAGFSWFSGGYVGVDVFFVISGYLITSIILGEQAHGRFSILGFYERRARRILPALFLVAIACLPFAWLWMTPHHLKSFAQSLVATVFFLPNVYFVLKSGYFDADADEKPLLHMWSLGVEEQYYIFFPLLVIWSLKRSSRVLVAVVAAIAIVSLALSEWASWTHQLGNFYLAPTRAWELAIGSLVAMASAYGTTRLPVRLGPRNLLALVGVLGIAVPVFVYQQSTRFPGLFALAPTLGTALIIAFARTDTYVGRLLSLRWVVVLGLISYSLYLWHQPLFAFARLRSTGIPSPWLFGALSVASIALAYGTWRMVEIPFRDRGKFTRKNIFTLALSGTVTFAGLGLVGHFAEGLPGRLSPGQQQILTFGDRPENRTEGVPKADCFLTPGQGASSLGRCVENEAAAGQSVFLWGDSHAAHLYSGLSRHLKGASKFTYLTVSACPPLVVDASGLRASCLDANRAILARIQRERPDRVIVAAVWGNYSWRTLASTLQLLKEAGIQNIDIVGPVPRWVPSLPVVMARFGTAFSALPERSNLGLDPVTRRLDYEMKRFSQQNGIGYVSPYSILCNEGGCLMRAGQEVESMVQWDVSHLTVRGSEFLVSQLWR